MVSGPWTGALGLGHGPEVVVCPSEGARVLLPGSHPGLYARPDPATTCSLREHSNNSVLAGFDDLRFGNVEQAGSLTSTGCCPRVSIALIHSGQDAFPIRNIVVPHSPQAPLVAALAFFIVTC